MAAPRRMTKNTLNALKGWPRPHAVDFKADLDSSVTVDPVLSGMCVHVDPTSGDFKLGVGTLNVMPMWLIHDGDDPDIENDGGDVATEAGAWKGVTPSGKHAALVAIGAYELVTTEYVDDTYTPNELLTSALGNGATAGKMKTATLGTDLICGMVSRGVVNNGYGHNALAFWPVVFPVYP